MSWNVRKLRNQLQYMRETTAAIQAHLRNENMRMRLYELSRRDTQPFVPGQDLAFVDDQDVDGRNDVLMECATLLLRCTCIGTFHHTQMRRQSVCCSCDGTTDEFIFYHFRINADDLSLTNITHRSDFPVFPVKQSTPNTSKKPSSQYWPRG